MYNDYGYNNYGAAPDMRRRLDMMQRQQAYQQPYMTPPVMPPQNGINGRIVTSIEEARAAQIPLDGTAVYFPAPAENKIYVKYIGLDGMPVFNVYQIANEVKQPVYAEAGALQALQQRVAQLESMVKGEVQNVQSNADNTANGAVAK